VYIWLQVSIHNMLIFCVLFIKGVKWTYNREIFCMMHESYKNGKGKVVSVHAMKAYRGSRGLALPILNLTTGCIVTLKNLCCKSLF
jgi:hypothetical protein